MSPEQCREARERLNWTRHELAVAADVPLWFIVAFEDGKETPAFLAHYEVAMRQALEDVGIGFPFVLDKGEIAAAGISYSPRDKRETH
jgi:DNA-binding XRE family transcriptional regulator